MSSNIPGYDDRFFCRSSSAQEDGEKMIAEFLEYLFKMAGKLQELLPEQIVKAADELSQMLKGQEFSKSKCAQQTLLNHLKSYCKLSVYGFNSGKNSFYDLRNSIFKFKPALTCLLSLD